MMNKLKLLILVIVSCLCSFACSTESNEGQPSGITTDGNSLPVISIVTDDGLNAFATEPVNGYVSSQIASWTYGYEIPPEPYYVDCKVSVTGTDSKFCFNSANAKVKVRGNWTTSYEKKPFRIDFEEKQNLLGLNDGTKYKNWVLLSEYKDTSLLRNKVALDISNVLLGEDGLYASDAELVELYINNEYWGIYLVAELQQINKGRVDITKTEPDYEGTDIGYFLEFDGYYFTEEPLQQFEVDYHKNAPLKPFTGNEDSNRTMTCLPDNKFDAKKNIGFTIKNDIYSQKQHDFIESFVSDVYWIMYEAAYNKAAYVFNEDYSDIVLTTDITPEEAVKRVVDVNSLADMYLISELTCDADLYWSSFFMTVDFGPEGNKKLTFQAPWDFDSALGNKARCTDGTGFYAANIMPDVNGDEYETINPWLAVISHESWYQDIIRNKWNKLNGSGIFDKEFSLIEYYKSEHEEAFQRNVYRWGLSNKNPDIMAELSVKSRKCMSQGDAADQLENWLKARVKFIDDYWKN